jgi:hypothetical protein
VNGIPNPFENPEAWETLVITDGHSFRLALPGIVTVDVRGVGLKEDTLDVPGQDGTTRTFLGYTDAEADVLIDVWNADQFNRAIKAIDIFRPRRKAKPVAYTVLHPNLQAHNILYMYIFDIKAPDYTSENGYQVMLQMREWQEETKKRTSGASKTKGAGKGGAGTGKGSGAGNGANNANNAGKGNQNTSQQKAAANLPSKRPTSSIVKGFQAGSTAASGLLGGK